MGLFHDKEISANKGTKQCKITITVVLLSPIPFQNRIKKMNIKNLVFLQSQ